MGLDKLSNKDILPAMRLEKYLKDNGIKLSDFATRVGAANAGVVSKYVNGRVPRPRIMAAIVRETGGAVQPNDFFEAA